MSHKNIPIHDDFSILRAIENEKNSNIFSTSTIVKHRPIMRAHRLLELQLAEKVAIRLEKNPDAKIEKIVKEVMKLRVEEGK